MPSSKVLRELSNLADDLQHVIRNLEELRLQFAGSNESELPGLGDAREQVDSLMWQTATLMFWSNYSIKGNPEDSGLCWKKVSC